MSRDVLHYRTKADPGRIALDGNRPYDLHSGLRILRSRHLDLAVPSFCNLSEGEGPVINGVRVPHPVLLVVIALGQQPDFVSAVVEPLIGHGRKVLAGKFWIDEEVRMSRKRNLYETPAVLWHQNQLHPPIGNLLRLPTLVADRLHAALVMLTGITLTRGSTQCECAPCGNQNESGYQPRHSFATCKPCTHRRSLTTEVAHEGSMRDPFSKSVRLENENKTN